MMRPFIIIATALSLITSAAIAADRQDIRLLGKTKISLTEAIAKAEANIGGKAVEANLDDDASEPIYEVSVVRGQQIFDVRVDAVNGSILSSREDLDD